jgi:hypothetical protein
MAIMPHPPLIGLLVEEGVGLGPEAADMEGLHPEQGHEQDPADSDDDDSDEEYEPEGQQRGRLFQLLGRYLYPLFTLGLSPRCVKAIRIFTATSRKTGALLKWRDCCLCQLLHVQKSKAKQANERLDQCNLGYGACGPCDETTADQVDYIFALF